MKDTEAGFKFPTPDEVQELPSWQKESRMINVLKYIGYALLALFYICMVGAMKLIGLMNQLRVGRNE